MRVLIAEDNEDEREAVARDVREYLGADICFAWDGLEMLELALREEYGLIITDNIMPKIKGIEAVRRIRENGYRGRVWMMSSDYKLKDEALKAGVDDFYCKTTVLDVDRFLEDLEKLRGRL